MAVVTPNLQRFARDVITGLGGTPSPSAVRLFLAQQRKEGGWTHNTAAFNPLNRTDKGFPTMNKVGVAVYPNYRTGVQRTVELIGSGYPALAKAYVSGKVNFADPGLQGDLNRWLTGKRTPGVTQYVNQIAGFYGQPVSKQPAVQTPVSRQLAAAPSSFSPPSSQGSRQQALAAMFEWMNQPRGETSFEPFLSALTAARNAQAVTPPGAPPAPVPLSAGAGGEAASANGYPQGWLTDYRPLGIPGAGTHTLGNWQSDNAYDLGAKAGTPVYSAYDATVGAIRPGEMSGRFGGYGLYLDTPQGQVYLKHLAENLAVRSGQKIKAGTLLGYLGAISGLTPHLHVGYERLPSNRR